MSTLPMLSEAQMRRLQPFFPISRGLRRVDDQRVISGIIYVIRYGMQWKDAPPGYGPPKTLYNRFIRWSRLGVFARIFVALAAKGGAPARLMIDATHLKAHRTAASLLQTYGPPRRQVVSVNQPEQSAQTYPAFRRAVGQDGEPRVLVLIKGPASKAILRRRFPGHRLNSQAIFLSPPTDIDGRRRMRRPVPIRQPWGPPCSSAHAAARPKRCAPSWRRARQRPCWDGSGRAAREARHPVGCCLS